VPDLQDPTTARADRPERLRRGRSVPVARLRQQRTAGSIAWTVNQRPANQKTRRPRSASGAI